MSMIKNRSFEMRSALAKCAIGIVAGFLNLALSSAAIKLHVPLFMDTLFTVTAACFSWTSGIVAAISLHILSFVAHSSAVQNLVFFFCSLTMVACVRLVLFPKRAEGTAESGGSKPLRLLILTLVFSLVISFEGGLFHYVLINQEKSNIGNQAVLMLIYTFVTQNTPMLVSTTLARFPVNLVDKAFAVFGGYGFFALLQKIFRNRSRQENQNKKVSPFDIWGGGTGVEVDEHDKT